MQVLFLKFLSPSGFFPQVFDITNELLDFCVSTLANVEDFFNVNIFFKCKYKCEYERLFCNVEFELIQMILQHRTRVARDFDS